MRICQSVSHEMLLGYARCFKPEALGIERLEVAYVASKKSKSLDYYYKATISPILECK
jgi:hypothetical protein